MPAKFLVSVDSRSQVITKKMTFDRKIEVISSLSLHARLNSIEVGYKSPNNKLLYPVACHIHVC